MIMIQLIVTQLIVTQFVNFHLWNWDRFSSLMRQQ